MFYVDGDAKYGIENKRKKKKRDLNKVVIFFYPKQRLGK